MSSKKAPQPEKSYSVGDIVLAKVKGYPAWPAHIVENESAPPGVRREKPNKGKTMYLVQFFPTGDYSWQIPKDLSALSAKEIEVYLSNSSKKNGDLRSGYQTAQNPQAWIDDRARQLAAYEQLQAAAEHELDEDQLPDDEPNSAKRKRDDKDDKKKKKAKTDKLAKSRAGASSGGQAEDSSADKKSKPAGSLEGEEEPGLKQTRDWRHKLQKVFLGKQPLNDVDVKKCTEYFDQMENFDMRKDWLLTSKLGKVLKRIALLAEGDIPNESKFNFRGRSTQLTKQWAALSGEEDGHADEGKPNGSHAEASPAPKDEA